MGLLEGTGLPFVSGRATFNERWCELQLSRERRKKRVDVEIFRPILAKFALPRASQKSCTARSCAYKKLNYRI